MSINFENGSTINLIESNSNQRGNRSNFVTIMCYDVFNNEWVLKTLNTREPIGRYIPEWMYTELLNKENKNE